MSYPTEWWSNPSDPYKDDKIYLSDGRSMYRWMFNGDSKMIISYEQWKLIPKKEYKIKPLPFIMSNANERESVSMDRLHDKLVHGL